MRYTCAASLTAIVLSSWLTDVVVAADVVPEIEWHQLVMAGKPAGYLQVSTLPREGGGHAVRSFTKLVVSRANTSLVMEILEETEEDENGKLRGFLVEQKMSQRTTTIRGRIRGAVIEVTTEVEGGKPRQTELPFDTQSIGPHRAEAVARERLKKAGDVYEFVTLVPQLQRCGKQTFRLGPEEETDLPGGRRKLRRLDVEQDLVPTGPIKQWVDAEFRLIKSAIPVLGMTIETYRSTQEAILAADYTSPPEIFVASSVPVRGKVHSDAPRIRYRLRWKSDAGGRERDVVRLPAAGGQELVRTEENGRVWVLDVRALNSPSGATRPSPASDELRPYLEPGTYVQSDDAKIKELARNAVGEETDSWKAAVLLEKWVFLNVKEKNLHTAFATASEVAERLEGDCTEHAVLLAAMARAAGIPSRVVAGLVYVRGSFFGHLWTEVHCGEWIPLDATTGKGRVGPDHIALAAASLSDSSLVDAFLGLIPLMGNLEIEVLAVEE